MTDTDTNQFTAREIAALLMIFNQLSSYEVQEITGLDVGEVSELNYKLLGM
jgi:helix-turn-helix protein